MSIPTALLSKIWHQANIIVSHYHVLDVGNGYAVTEFSACHKVSILGKSLKCDCRTFKATTGICSHVLVVADHTKELSSFLSSFNQKDTVGIGNIPKRAGEKPRDKKKRKGKNNVKSVPVLNQQAPIDPDIDSPKPVNFTAIHHNSNPFIVVFTKEFGKKKMKCQSCKVEFPTSGKMICIPYDIAIVHSERYYYPVKNAQGQVAQMHKVKL